MSTKHVDYECPRCGYTTHHKGNMRHHLFNKNKACPATKHVIDLTESIKDYVLNNKIYPVSTQFCVEHMAQNIVPKTQVSKRPISKALKIACWNRFIGEEVGKAKCVCCNLHSITQHHFHCGHVLAEAQGGKVLLENLRPICAICNHSMGTMNMRQFALTQFNVDIQ